MQVDRRATREESLILGSDVGIYMVSFSVSLLVLSESSALPKNPHTPEFSAASFHSLFAFQPCPQLLPILSFIVSSTVLFLSIKIQPNFSTTFKGQILLLP